MAALLTLMQSQRVDAVLLPVRNAISLATARPGSAASQCIPPTNAAYYEGLLCIRPHDLRESVGINCAGMIRFEGKGVLLLLDAHQLLSISRRLAILVDSGVGISGAAESMMMNLEPQEMLILAGWDACSILIGSPCVMEVDTLVKVFFPGGPLLISATLQSAREPETEGAMIYYSDIHKALRVLPESPYKPTGGAWSWPFASLLAVLHVAVNDVDSALLLPQEIRERQLEDLAASAQVSLDRLLALVKSLPSEARSGD